MRLIFLSKNGSILCYLHCFNIPKIKNNNIQIMDFL